jgi:hypothetical protein
LTAVQARFTLETIEAAARTQGGESDFAAIAGHLRAVADQADGEMT